MKDNAKKEDLAVTAEPKAGYGKAAKNKAAAKEPESKDEKDEKTVSSGRDSSTFTLTANGKKIEGLNKGRLALSIVEQAVVKNKGITLPKLKELFPDEIVKPYSVVLSLADAKKFTSKESKRERFFLKDGEPIKLKNETIAVTNQWSGSNLKPMIAIAKKLGFTIK